MHTNGLREVKDGRSHSDSANTRSMRLEENNFRANKRSTDFHSTPNSCVEVPVPAVLYQLKCKRAQG